MDAAIAFSPYADNIDWRHFSPFGKSLVQRSSTLCNRHFTWNCLVNAGGSWKIDFFFFQSFLCDVKDKISSETAEKRVMFSPLHIPFIASYSSFWQGISGIFRSTNWPIKSLISAASRLATTGLRCEVWWGFFFCRCCLQTGMGLSPLIKGWTGTAWCPPIQQQFS